MSSFPSNPLGHQGLQAQASIFSDLARRSYDATRRLGELNLQLMQQLLSDSAEASRQVSSCTNPVQVMAVAFSASQPAIEHLRTYQSQLMSLMTNLPASMPRPTQHLQQAARGGDSVSGGDVLTNASRASDIAGAAGYTRTH